MNCIMAASLARPSPSAAAAALLLETCEDDGRVDRISGADERDSMMMAGRATGRYRCYLAGVSIYIRLSARLSVLDVIKVMSHGAMSMRL